MIQSPDGNDHKNLKGLPKYKSHERSIKLKDAVDDLSLARKDFDDRLQKQINGNIIIIIKKMYSNLK